MLYTLIITWKEMNKVEWTLPGTVLSVDADRPQAAEEVFSSLFLAGGLVLSQVTQVTGLEPYIIQNWVRRGFLAPPKQRKYTRRQLSRILMINALKSTLSIERPHRTVFGYALRYQNFRPAVPTLARPSVNPVIPTPGFYEPAVGFNARCGAGVLVLLSVCRLYIFAANGSGTNAFTLRGCGIRDTYIDYAN